MTQHSRAALFHAAGAPFELTTFPLPNLGPGEVLVRVECCTVCGSDLHTFSGDRSTAVPTVLGHEIIGRIIDLRAPTADSPSLFQTQSLNVGDRVTWSIAASCGTCFYCLRKWPQKCETLFKYGHERAGADHPLSGGLAEYCHLKSGTAVYPVPEQLSDRVACPANCATATIAGALRTAGDLGDQIVLIQGAGLLGLTAAAMACTQGAKAVIVTDVAQIPLQRATRFGATHPVSVAEGNGLLRETVSKTSSGRGVDVAIDVSGANRAVVSAIEHLRIGGRLILVGSVSPAPPIEIAAETIVRRCLTIRGLHNYRPEDLAAALDFLAKHHASYPFEELVAQTFPLSDVDAAFRYALDARPPRVAIVSD
jgi:alcohol dehydrogenase